MEDLYAGIIIISAILSIIVLIKFFQIANDLKSLNEKFKHVSQISNDVHFIKQRVDGELNYLTEERSNGEIQFLVFNGYKEEAKRMLLRKIWKCKNDYTYEELKQNYNHFFITIGEKFPTESDLGLSKVSNPV